MRRLNLTRPTSQATGWIVIESRGILADGAPESSGDDATLALLLERLARETEASESAEVGPSTRRILRPVARLAANTAGLRRELQLATRRLRRKLARR